MKKYKFVHFWRLKLYGISCKVSSLDVSSQLEDLFRLIFLSHFILYNNYMITISRHECAIFALF